MALTSSRMLELGTQAPDFDLPDTEGVHWSLASYSEKQALLVMFICNHCPYVIHLKEHLAQLARDYSSKGLGIIAINANDAESYPSDSLENMAKDVKQYGYIFPYVYDQTQATASAYHAACTPDFYLFNTKRELTYRGQFDSSRPGNGVPVSGDSLRLAIDATLSGRMMPTDQIPSLGCNIKWKPGNAPI